MLQIKSAYVEITDRCNLDCKFCYNRSGGKHQHQEIPVNDIRAIIEKFIPFGLESMAFSGGEPFLHSDWNSIYELIIEYAKIKFSVITNGTIDNPYLYKLSSIKNFHIQVSLDGHDEQSNSMIRGYGNFYKALETIGKLKMENKILLKLVISRLNRHSIETFTNLALSIGAQPEFAFVNNMGNATDIWGNISLTPVEKIRIIKQIKKLSEKNKVDIFLPFCAAACPLDNENQPVAVLIKPDGSIYPCQQLYDVLFCFGNAVKSSPAELDRNFTRIRAMAGERLTLVYNCTSCINRTLCKKGCMAEAYHNSGHYLAADGNCEMRIRQSLELGLSELLEKCADE